MATPILGGTKITALPEVLSAAPGDWLVIVVTNAKGIAVTSRIKKSNLVP